LGWRCGEAVDRFFERCTPALRLRQGLTVAILTVLILVIFAFISIIGEEVLKHGQPYSSTGIRHGGRMT